MTFVAFFLVFMHARRRKRQYGSSLSLPGNIFSINAEFGKVPSDIIHCGQSTPSSSLLSFLPTGGCG